MKGYDRLKNSKWEPSEIDMHMHSTASDGTDCPGQLALKARETGLTFFAITDHDTYDGCAEAEETLAEQTLSSGDGREEKNFAFVRGIEFSCRDEYGKYHILGYAFHKDAPEIRAIMKEGHDGRIAKTVGRIEFLKEQFNIIISEEEKAAILANRNPGKPHIGRLLVEKGYAPDINTAIRTYLNPYKDKIKYLDPERAIAAILASGGIPVLAHPIYGDGAQQLSKEEVLSRVERMKGYGLQGLECYYSKHTEEETTFLLSIAEERDMLISAGSDYHGENKNIRLGQTGLSGTELHPLLQRFLEICKGGM